MTTQTLTPSLFYRDWDNNGNPLVGGLVYTYLAGTTTPAATYTDSTGVTSNTNPVVLNARGEAAIWLPVNISYKFVVTDSTGTTIRTVDNVINSTAGGLYAGTSTGAANAYVLTYATSWTSLSDGVTTYWLPSATNTGASTINVNATGAITITNPDGSALVAGQIVAGQVCAIIYRNSAWRLLLTGSVPLVIPGFVALNAGTTVPDSAGTQYAVGYSGIPQNAKSGAYTAVLADANKHIYYTGSTSVAMTIPANSAVAYPIGTVLTFVNDAAAAVSITVAINTDVLVWSPSGATGTRTLSQYGRAVAQKVASQRWLISGTGLT